MSTLADYVKCVKENKFALAGYILTTVGAPVLAYTWPEHFSQATKTCMYGYIATLLGTNLLCLTNFGIGTLRSYERTKKHILKFNRIDQRFANKFKMPCDRIGLRLAAQESQLEKTVN